MPKILLAFDSFKDTLTAEKLSEVVKQTLLEILSECEVRCKPVSDGGQGFIGALKQSMHLESVPCRAIGPLGNEIDTEYAFFNLANGERVAVIEMAKVSGLESVPSEKRNPLNTTTHGLGQLLKKAEKEGSKKIILGLGGSATSDGGLGLIYPLGGKVILEGDVNNYEDNERILFGRDLLKVKDIPKTTLLQNVSLQIAVDVQNPFTGRTGAVHVFAKQKGADEQTRNLLESAMISFQRLLETISDKDLTTPGTGAAGGVCGLLFCLAENVEVKSGIQIVADSVGIVEAIEWADVVFTGEGSYDYQTEKGKTISLIKRECQKLCKPLIILCGRVDKEILKEDNVQVFDLVSRYGMESSMTSTAECLDHLLKEIKPQILELF